MPTRNTNKRPLEDHLIAGSATVREALERLNLLSGGNMTLFVTDGDGRLAGTLTDGDIRRALTSGASVDTHASEVCNTGCLRVEHECDRYPVALEARRRGVSLLPLLRDGRVVDIVDLSRMKGLLPLDAVLMAGGRGERLRPLTDTVPKPLLRIGGRPIIDYNIENLVAHGVETVYVTVNYLKESIEEHFVEPVRYAGREVGVKCVREPRRLGTMGSLALVPELTQENLVVMNSDLLTNVDFAEMYARHVDSDADLTMGVVPYNVSIPFAIVEHDEKYITALAEKPTYSYLANAGVYMMRREVAQGIGEDYLDAPDLIHNLISGGRKVSFYPIDGIWMDIGSPHDFRMADDLMKSRRSL